MGIDTEELKNDNLESKKRAFEARHKILKICCDNYNLNVDCSRHDIQKYLNDNDIYVCVECFEFDKYGRILANVYKDEGDLSLSEVLLESKLAYKYDGGNKQKNCIFMEIVVFCLI